MIQTIIDWLISHQYVLAGLIVGILDFIIALVPSWESNGIFHSIYLFFKNLTGKKAVGV